MRGLAGRGILFDGIAVKDTAFPIWKHGDGQFRRYGVFCAFLVLADLILIYRTDLSPKVGVLATVLALVGAFKFTQWYPGKTAPSKAS